MPDFLSLKRELCFELWIPLCLLSFWFGVSRATQQQVLQIPPTALFVGARDLTGPILTFKGYECSSSEQAWHFGNCFIQVGKTL